MTLLEQLAREVAVVAPIKRAKYTAGRAYISWGIVQDIRDELDRRGIDWRKEAASLKSRTPARPVEQSEGGGG